MQYASLIWPASFIPQINLFAIRFSHHLSVYVPPVPDPAACAVLALVKAAVRGPPPDSDHKEGSQEGKGRQGHSHPSGRLLAGPSLVSRSSPSLSCSIHQAPAGPSVPSAAQGRGSTRKPKDNAPSRLASVGGLLSSLGSCPPVLCLVEHAHRPATQGVYYIFGWLGQMVCGSFIASS